MRKILAALGTLCLAFGLATYATPAEGATDHPVVKPAVFKSSNDVAVQIADAVQAGWKVVTVVNDTDSRLGPPPDFHYAQCDAHPNWGCIRVRLTSSGQYWSAQWNSATDTAAISLNPSPTASPSQAGFCRAFGAVLRISEHRENQGCRRVNYQLDDKLFSASEMTALRNKYDRAARDPDPDTGTEAGEDSGGLPADAPRMAGRLPDARFAKMNPCDQEDSRECAWDAVHMGSGGGDSFWTPPAGVARVYYNHAPVHRILYGTWSDVPASAEGDRVDLINGGTRVLSGQTIRELGDKATLYAWPGGDRIDYQLGTR